MVYSDYSSDPTLNKEISFNDVSSAISEAKSKWTPGFDRFPNILFKNLTSSYVAWLTKLYNQILIQRDFPHFISFYESKNLGKSHQ